MAPEWHAIPGDAFPSLLNALCAILDALAEFEEARGDAQEARLLACWQTYRTLSGYRTSSERENRPTL